MHVQQLGDLGDPPAVLRSLAAAARDTQRPAPAALIGSWYGSRAIIAPSLATRPVLPPDGITVRHSGTDELAAWLDVVVDGFAAPDGQGVPSHESFPREVLSRAIGALATVEGEQRYVALRDGAVAGGASMRLLDGVAQLNGAATAAPHRRRGIQTALLTTRLHEAAREGADLAVVTTQPGSKSQQNTQRQGFSLLYTRAILVKGLRN
ncbi:Hypothetical acetyltransferase%2C GNAT family [Mycobacteroides abscessus]|nr:Hypothetical acetyltransferase%2C GNAT family [Mycobacteroides abscessus]